MTGDFRQNQFEKTQFGQIAQL